MPATNAYLCPRNYDSSCRLHCYGDCFGSSKKRKKIYCDTDNDSTAGNRDIIIITALILVVVISLVVLVVAVIRITIIEGETWLWKLSMACVLGTTLHNSSCFV